MGTFREAEGILYFLSHPLKRLEAMAIQSQWGPLLPRPLSLHAVPHWKEPRLFGDVANFRSWMETMKWAWNIFSNLNYQGSYQKDAETNLKR